MIWTRLRKLLGIARRELPKPKDYWGSTKECHVCGARRAKQYISEREHPLIQYGEHVGTQVIRYCNDRQECKEKSKDTRHVDRS